MVRFRGAAAAVFAVVLVTMVGCSAPPSSGGGGGGPTVWTIPAGAHDATAATVAFTATDTLEFRTRFDSSAEYATADPDNQADVNKLRGVSDCGTHHQTNSARFGWRWNVDRVEILAYTYVAGVRDTVLLGTVQPGEWHDYRLELTPTGYEFTLDGATTTTPRGCGEADLAKYHLWPYFGGDEVAPHTITIEIEQLVG